MADRHSKYRILLITQGASMVQAILLAALVFAGHFHIYQILLLSTVLGIINAFDVPARQPMVHDMVEHKEDIQNALALNATIVNLARLIGPALSGIVLQHFGAAVCFSLNAISFIAVLSSLLLMRLPAFVKTNEKKKVFAELKDGFFYVRESGTIGGLIVMITLLSLFVLPYDTVLPVFAKLTFNGDAETYGFINSFIGVGAIVSSLVLAANKKESSLLKILIGSSLVLGVSLILFSQFSNFYWAMGAAVALGFGSMAPMTSCITIIQMEAAAHMKGRVMSYVALSFFGMLPLGGLLVGLLSQTFSASGTLLAEGCIAIAVTFFFSIFFKRKKVY